MKSYQSPHEELTEEQIKEIVSHLTVEIRELKEFFDEQLEYLTSCAYKLKRHFCPDKFTTMELKVSDIDDLMLQTFGDPGFTKTEVE